MPETSSNQETIVQEEEEKFETKDEPQEQEQQLDTFGIA